MRETIKLALRLCVFTLIAGLLLAATNEITKDSIANQADSLSRSARTTVLPEAMTFERMDLDIGAFPAVDAVFRGVSGEETVGYAVSLSPDGYKGEILMTLGVTATGAISGLTVDGQSETAGLGSRIAGRPYLDQYLGKPADSATIVQEVDAIAGATVSSVAVSGAVEQALTILNDQLGIEGRSDRALAERGALSEGESNRLLMFRGGRTIRELTPYSAFQFSAITRIYQVSVEGGTGYVIDLDLDSPASVVYSLALSPDGLIESILMEGGAGAPSEAFTSELIGLPVEAALDTVAVETDGQRAFLEGVRQAAAFYTQHLSEKEAGQP